MYEWVSPALVGLGVAVTIARDKPKSGAESQLIKDQGERLE